MFNKSENFSVKHSIKKMKEKPQAGGKYLQTTVWQFLNKAEHNLNIYFSNQALRYLPEWFKNINPHKNPLFIAASFIVTKNWKQPRCPLIYIVHLYNGLL